MIYAPTASGYHPAPTRNGQTEKHFKKRAKMNKQIDVTTLFKDAISSECELSDFTELAPGAASRWVLSASQPANAVERCDAFGQTFWGLSAYPELIQVDAV
ncbi:hypothetical protein [uncultured Microbulbifer sp.]|mgnify:CR=1 FL=1|uniref:hypothetical protein n=1 Tax=uncultured Microbulbifer sp. TaxID=348147 RepID=UPI0025DE5973|nr:hypothetical protein [uncultured Microbulbifer sp.]